jgi:hypothetical protein
MDEMIEDPRRSGSGIMIRNPLIDDPGIVAMRLLSRWATRYQRYRERGGKQLAVFDDVYDETMKFFAADDEGK